ncbi:MAG: DNA alkylation repair protein [Corallococcus sp.]|nr:DNA alkylation repair protein [Corallococcus sp.]
MEKLNSFEQLVEYLQENSDKTYDEFNNKIINTSLPTIGCKIPFLRRLSKFYTVDDVAAFPVNKYVETDLLKGIVISESKLPFDVKSELLTEFAYTIENWAVCDCLTVKAVGRDREKYFDFFCKLALSDKTFVCRYGIVNLLSNYLDGRHISIIFETLKSVTLYGEYYVDMAVAWLVATAMAKCRSETKEFMEGDARVVLTGFSYNKALQKMRDSRRISAEDKLWTYSLKII